MPYRMNQQCPPVRRLRAYPTFMLYRLFGLMLGRVGRRVGSGGAPLGAAFECVEPVSEVEVAGVVPEDAKVEDDFVRDMAPLRSLPLA